jgi:hypothetical protein
MVDNFDEFAKKRAQQQQDREKVENDTKPEWVALKGFAETLAQDGKGVDGFKFEWVPDAYAPRLILGAVAATFLERERNGKLVECRVHFDRKPLGANQLWITDAPFGPEDWTLTPTSEGDDNHWMIAEVNAQLPNKKLSFSSSELAGKVGIKLAELLDVYNKAFPNWNIRSSA